ncbi:Intercellular signal essential for a variety of patterning events during development (By similarity) [Seminavis robusta]|uniref:Intercellular signal essential for a variety of patterning events during development By similarity n=1 Tax=Seminavis robusta TaxID=568900 RepID=A0A9N8DQK4_9STRA|nr:Intercellular signal essential for a variety of patterning events during development (By similarity) [Seminavis robusta]|eukprot:Sro187_g080860.1 Intercellular signal essential for a variety of patterning events during development (By similarity) (440) ;mRNA; r:21736-23271
MKMLLLCYCCLLASITIGSVVGSLSVTELTSGTSAFVRVKTEPSFNFYQLNTDTASGSKTTCTISSIQVVNLILAIRYGDLPDAFGTADCVSDTSGSAVGSNSETCEATAASDSRAYVQVVADDASTSNAENALDILCTTTAPTSTSEPDTGGGACFSGDMTVRVRDREWPVKMKDLQVGDWVLQTQQTTHENDEYEYEYQPIYAMAHVEEDAVMEYLEIETEHAPKPLVVSRDHLVFLEGTKHPVAAQNLAVGDSLFLMDTTTIHNNATTTTTTTRITNIGTTYRRGKYAPLTPDGTIVVNGIVASTYVAILGKDMMELQQHYRIMSWHTFIHVLYMAPIRMACVHHGRVCPDYLFARDPATGYAKFVAAGFQMAEWVHRQNMPVQLFLLILTMVVLGPLALLEQMGLFRILSCISAATIMRGTRRLKKNRGTKQTTK